MSGTIAIRDPRAEMQGNIASVLPTLGDVAGKTAAILNNGWTSMDRIASLLAPRLKAMYGIREVENIRIPIANAADPALLDSLARRADLAIVGLAN